MARIDTLGHFLTDVADAIRTKKGSGSTIQASSFDTEIASIPSGGGEAVEKKDINFYDYDGTILHSYTKSEFNNLQAMPDNPTHEGLTSMGWNWTLEEAKTYLTHHNYLEIGQQYKTDDGKTRIYVSLSEFTLNPYVSIGINGTATIDWGDNTTSTITGSSISTPVDTQHTYSSAGDYVITIYSTSNIYNAEGTNYRSKLFWSGGDTESENTPYLSSVTKIEFSDNFSINYTYGLNKLYNLKSLILPYNNGNLKNYSLSYCSNLKHLTIPRTGTYYSQYVFERCFNLKSVSLPATMTNTGNYMFAYCYSLERITMPDTLNYMGTYTFRDNYSLKIVEYSTSQTSVNSSTFYNTHSLKEIYLPSNVANIQGSAFNLTYSLGKVTASPTSISSNGFVGCVNTMIFDFTGCSSVPSMSSTGFPATLKTGCKIIVPDDLYDTWITKQAWVNLTDYIVKESEA